MGSFEQAEKKFRDWRGKLIERLRRVALVLLPIDVIAALIYLARPGP